MKNFSIILLALVAFSCSNTKQNNSNASDLEQKITQNVLEGTWVLKNILMGDALDAPCGFMNEEKVREMNITFTANANGTMTLNGQSSVNSFSGKFSILSYDTKSKTGKIMIEQLVSTKMAAVNSDFMECENRYFSYLENTEEFKIEEGKLQLIKSTPLPKSDLGNAPFGESYKSILYFDKKIK